MLQFKDNITLVDCIVTEETALNEALGLNHTNPLNTPIRQYIKNRVETIKIDTPMKKISFTIN